MIYSRSQVEGNDGLDFGCGTHPFPYACFTCRKSFKRPLVGLAKPFGLKRSELVNFAQANHRFMAEFKHRCPQCGDQAHFMGRDFKAPKVCDIKGWKRVQRFIASGRVYHHGIATHDVKWPLQAKFN